MYKTDCDFSSFFTNQIIDKYDVKLEQKPVKQPFLRYQLACLRSSDPYHVVVITFRNFKYIKKEFVTPLNSGWQKLFIFQLAVDGKIRTGPFRKKLFSQINSWRVSFSISLKNETLTAEISFSKIWPCVICFVIYVLKKKNDSENWKQNNKVTG